MTAETSRAMRGLFGRDSLYVVLFGLQLLIAAAITPAATRLLSAHSYGRIMAAFAVMQILVAIGSVNLQSAVQRQYHRENGERDARRLVTLAIAISLTTFIVADLTGPWWCSLLRLGAFHGAIQDAVAWAALTAISDAGLAWIRCRDRLYLFAAVSLVQSVGAAALSLALIAFVHRTAAEFVFGEALSQAAAVLLALAVARPLAIRRRDAGLVSGALRYTSALVPAAIASFGLNAADRLIIQHDLGSTPVGRYSIAYNIGSIPTILIAVLDNSWMPRMFALSGKLARGAVLSSSRDAVYALLIPTTIGINAGAPLVLAAWVPPGYHPSGLLIIVALLSIGAFPLAGAMAATRVLLVTGKTGPVGARTVVASVFTVALTIALVPPLHIDGAAIASVVGFGLLHVLLTRAARRVEPLPRPPRRLVAKCVVAVAIGGLFTQVPSSPAFWVLRAVVTLAGLAAFSAVMCDLVAPGRFARVSKLARQFHLGVPGS